MKLIAWLIALVKRLAFGWMRALCDLWRKLKAIFEHWRQQRRLPERARRADDAPCVKIDEEAFKRPDPLLYAQGDLMRRGYAVTWDNPDIELRRGGGAVPSAQLDPDTDYEVVARIWNNSTEAPVSGLPVIFSYLSFGIGATSTPIGATAVNLGVKGGPDHPAFASVKWRTPPTPGHYCLQVLLDPVDDVNYDNNLGQENTVVGKPHSPAEFTFLLRNAGRQPQAFRFEVDTYRLPPPPPCGPGERRPTQPSVTLRDGREAPPPPPAAHDRQRYPIPPDWTVAIDPAQPQLAAGAETTITVRIAAPAGFAGQQSFNVNAFDQQGFAGGVTLTVEAP